MPSSQIAATRVPVIPAVIGLTALALVLVAPAFAQQDPAGADTTRSRRALYATDEILLPLEQIPPVAAAPAPPPAAPGDEALLADPTGSETQLVAETRGLPPVAPGLPAVYDEGGMDSEEDPE